MLVVFLLVFVPLAILMTAGCKLLLRGEDNSGLAYLLGPFFALFPALMVSSAGYTSLLVKTHGLGGFIGGLLFFVPFFALLVFCGLLRLGLLGQQLSRRQVRTRATPRRPLQHPTVYRFRKETGQFQTVTHEPEEG